MTKLGPPTGQFYSSDLKRVYDSWEELVAAEANGWVAVAILRELGPKRVLFTALQGPYDDKADAEKARRAMRTKFKRSARKHRVSELVTTNVKPLWKDVS